MSIEYRNINGKQIEILIEQLRHMATRLYGKEVEKFRTNCVNCLHFDEKSETCKLYNARPPARIISYGCKDFGHIDEIPF